MTIRSILFSALAAALVAMPAAAQSFAQLHQNHTRGELPYITESGGLVNYDGSVLTGGRYYVTHTQQGVYTISYDPGTWTATPVMTCTPAGKHAALAVCNVQDFTITSAVVRMYRVSNGKPVNNAFAFTAVLTH